MSDIFSVLGEAIRQRDELTCTMSDVTLILCPHVLYESPNGRGFWVGGIRVPDEIPIYIPLSEMQNIAATGRTFGPDPHFDLDDPRYDNAVAVIETPWRQPRKPAPAQNGSCDLASAARDSHDGRHGARPNDSSGLGRFKRAVFAALSRSSAA